MFRIARPCIIIQGKNKCGVPAIFADSEGKEIVSYKESRAEEGANELQNFPFI
jgi:hypothetical protein